MAEEWVEIRCVRCGHRWSEDLSQLNKEGPVVYRGEDETQDYRVRCPQCGTVKVITITFGEAGNDG